MSTLTKMALAAFAGLLLGGGAFAVAQTSDSGATVTETTTVEQPGDVSGPCDEAEHADDPRCTGQGGQTGEREDNSGPGSANSGHGNSHDDDVDREDNSGPGNSHDDGGQEDDHSGSGHGDSGSSSGSSGSGHSGGSDDD